MIANVAQIVSCTEAEGPGRRFALWFQGCPLRCEGCCNPQMLSFAGGQQRLVFDLVDEIESARRQLAIEGITLLGGEPFAHASAASALARDAKARNLSVMVFSGYTLTEARFLPDPAVAELLSHTDILVDGPYLKDQPESRRRWIGSRNQSIQFLTDRYRADDPRWRQSNTIELRLHGTELTVNGFPSPSSSWLWRRPPRVVT